MHCFPLSRSPVCILVLSGCWAVLAGACSGPSATPVQPGPAGGDSASPLLMAADPQPDSFHGTRSAPVLAAAMRYPATVAATEPAAPFSLTASDGTGLQLVALDARAVIDGPLAFTELHLRFHNPRDRVIEGRFQIALADDATVSRLAMKLPTGWQEAEVVERQAARRAYEDFLHRRQDPALLETAAGNQFSARIFPIAARADKEIIISYSQPLIGPGRAGPVRYRLPLRGLPTIEELSVRAQVAEPRAAGATGYREVAMRERAQRPKDDFRVEVAGAIEGLAAGKTLAAWVRPEIDSRPTAPGSLLVLVDTSASRAPGFSGQIARLGRLMSALRQRFGDSLPVEVAAFDQVVVPVYAGALAGFGAEQLAALRAHRPLGASDLAGALAWAEARSARERVLLVSDVVPTAGATRADRLRARVQALAPETSRMDVVLVGGITDRALATRLGRGALAHDGVVLDGERPVEELARRLAQTTVSGIAVAIAGAEWVWPQQLDGLQPGDRALVFAGMAQPVGDRAELALSGPIQQKRSLVLHTAPGPLLARAAVGARIERLRHERDTLESWRDRERAALRQEIVELSVRHRVLADETALLVLETEDDYRRFGIERRSLADILVVGERGVEVLQRQAPVLLIAGPEGEKPAARGGSRTSESANGRTPDPGKNTAPTTRANAPAGTTPMPEPGTSGPDSDLDAVPDAFDDQDEVAEVAAEAKSAPAVADLKPAPAAKESEPPPPPKASGAKRVERELADELVVGDMVRPDGEMMETRSMSPSYQTVLGGRVSLERPEEEEEEAEPEENDAPAPAAREQGPPAYTGRLADIMALLARGEVEAAVVGSLDWRSEQPGDVMALIALGESLERAGSLRLAARAYGSIIDLFPARADMRRFAGERLDRLRAVGAKLAVDSYRKAVEQRPDHLTGHRLLAYALVRAGEVKAAFAAILVGLQQSYPSGRFLGGPRILREDLGIIAAVWIHQQPAVRADVLARLQKAGASLATQPSLRFVLAWETDANDVDFHIHDGVGGHAYYGGKELPSGGALYADVTNGYGPECFAIVGAPAAYPYDLRIHYYSRGPMGFGMGKLEVMAHDGAGGLHFSQRPFVVMNSGAYVELGRVDRADSGQFEMVQVR